MSKQALTPEGVLPRKRGEPLRQLQAAREHASRRATDPLWPLRDARGAVPMAGARQMPASELEAERR